jgi:hypothetical protein
VFLKAIMSALQMAMPHCSFSSSTDLLRCSLLFYFCAPVEMHAGVMMYHQKGALDIELLTKATFSSQHCRMLVDIDFCRLPNDGSWKCFQTVASEVP